MSKSKKVGAGSPFKKAETAAERVVAEKEKARRERLQKVAKQRELRLAAEAADPATAANS